MQGFGCVCVLLCLLLGLAVGQTADANITTTRPTEESRATLGPDANVTTRPTEESRATLGPDVNVTTGPTDESRATLAPDQPTLSPPICNKPGYDLGPLAR